MDSSNSAANCSVIFHNYYGDHEQWIRFFCERISIPFNLFYNIVEDSFYNSDGLEKWQRRFETLAAGSSLQRIILRQSPNKGKDIGGKLVLLDASLREGINAEYQIFLHDKKSPHKANGREWQERLFGIIEPSFIEKALTIFDTQKSVGIIATAGSIANEYDPASRRLSGRNRNILEKLRAAYSIEGPDHQYVAGTMFWVRSAPMLAFFRQHSPLAIRRTLEIGNIMDENAGSITHSWERMLSWLIFAQGYTIKGVL